MPDLAGQTYNAINPDQIYTVTIREQHKKLGERQYVQHWSGKALRAAIRFDPRVIDRIIKLEEPRLS